MLEAVKERLKQGMPVSTGSEYLPTHFLSYNTANIKTKIQSTAAVPIV